MLFFQLVLLGGYAYAHFPSRWLKPRGQAVVHCAAARVARGAAHHSRQAWKP